MKKIALIAPSSPATTLTPDTIRSLQETLAALGYQLHLESHVLDSDRYLAGSDEDRALDVMRAFTDETTDVVMTARGGYGSPRILDKLDYALLHRHAKPFLTISDGTALQTALYTKSGIVGYSGIQALFWLNEKNRTLIETAVRVLQNQPLTIPVRRIWRDGAAEGIMLGGNLVVFESLLGTPYFPDMTDKILVLEEVNEEPYKVDRMLAHLRLAGVLDRVGGVVLGDFSSCVAKDPADGTIEDVLQDYFGHFSKPVVQINYGHRHRETVVPIGKKVMWQAGASRIEEIG